MDVLMHRDGLDGRAFHLVSPEPMPLLDVVNSFLRAAGAPTVSLPIDRRVVAPVTNVVKAALRLPGATLASHVLLDRLAVPPERAGVEVERERALVGIGGPEEHLREGGHALLPVHDLDPGDDIAKRS